MPCCDYVMPCPLFLFTSAINANSLTSSLAHILYICSKLVFLQSLTVQAKSALKAPSYIGSVMWTYTTHNRRDARCKRRMCELFMPQRMAH